MFISRLFIGVISCSAATEKAHVINLSDAHRHDDYIRFLLTRPLLKRFHANRSPASSSLTIRLLMGQSHCFSKSTHCIFSMPVA